MHGFGDAAAAVGEAFRRGDFAAMPGHVSNEMVDTYTAAGPLDKVRELQADPKRPLKDILSDVLLEVRPSAHTRKLEYMDLVAVKECTDARFLPARFKELSHEELETRIDALRKFV